ncbi:type 1 glutamine amidotransferase [Syntrophomonas curvata]
MADYKIAHMYPDLMNLYGDQGNLTCLKRRLQWYGHRCVISDIPLNGQLDYQDIDMLFMGGGSDREQGLVYRDLFRQAERLQQEIENGLPVLFICGAYQLLGKSYIGADGETMDGLGFFDFYTRGAKDRLIGNIVINSAITGEEISIVGFENHGGRTYFQDTELRPLGRVVKGFGNNGEDGCEGISYKNLIGTYLHGPLLPKNPSVADFFIQAMAKRKGMVIDTILDDAIENYAHRQVKKQILGG